MPHLPYDQAAVRLNEALTALHATGPTPAIAAVLGRLALHPHVTVARWARRAIGSHALVLTQAVREAGNARRA